MQSIENTTIIGDQLLSTVHVCVRITTDARIIAHVRNSLFDVIKRFLQLHGAYASWVTAGMQYRGNQLVFAKTNQNIFDLQVRVVGSTTLATRTLDIQPSKLQAALRTQQRAGTSELIDGHQYTFFVTETYRRIRIIT